MSSLITRCLRRHGLWPVIAGATLIAIVLSLAISGFVHAVVLGIEMPLAAWLITIGCPLLIAPTMSFHSFSLLIRLDQAHEQLRVISITDHLTRAANRRHFMERLLAEAERSLRDGSPYSVALIDIDNFKAVNDEHGHLVGDEVLCRLAQACMAQVRDSDTFARFGGEEFAVLLPGTGVEQALGWLERLRQHVADLRVELPSATLAVTISIGLASPGQKATPAAAQIDAALRLADEALYRAKREGKNRVALPVPVAA
jgi:diguanylate cyclase (GGDEF)-like protein